MRDRFWRRARILVVFTMALAASGCGGGDGGGDSAQTPPPAAGDGPGGLITDFLGGAFENWGQAQFLTAIGLMPAPATEQQLDEVLADLGQIQNQLAEAQQELQTLIGDFIDLQQQMSQDDFQAQAELLQSITTSEYAGWTQFTNAVGDQTLAQVAANQQSTAALAGLLTDSFLNTLATQAAELSNTGAPGDELNSTVPDYLTSAMNLLLANMATLQSESQNVVTLFDQYNNGLMNQYYYLVQALQQIYTIEQTVLYLQANTTDFAGVTLAEPGILDSNTYEQNYGVLNSLFDERLTQLCKLFNGAIVSDAPQPVMCGSASAPPTTAANALSGVVAGEWRSACDLYVWLGTLPAGDQDFEGVWNGSSLTAECSGDSYSLNLSTCSAGTQEVSFYSGPDTGGGSMGQLQCSSLNGDDFTAPGWNGGAGDAFIGDWSNSQARHSEMCIGTSGLGSTPPYTAAISGPLSGSDPYCTNVGSLPGGSFSSVWQYSGPNGYVGAFAILGMDPVRSGGFGITVQMLCLSGDPWCSQLPGTASGGHYQQGSSSICIAGEKLTLQPSGASNGAIVFTNEAC